MIHLFTVNPSAAVASTASSISATEFALIAASVAAGTTLLVFIAEGIRERLRERRARMADERRACRLVSDEFVRSLAAVVAVYGSEKLEWSIRHVEKLPTRQYERNIDVLAGLPPDAWDTVLDAASSIRRLNEHENVGIEALEEELETALEELSKALSVLEKHDRNSYTDPISIARRIWRRVAKADDQELGDAELDEFLSEIFRD